MRLAALLLCLAPLAFGCGSSSGGGGAGGSGGGSANTSSTSSSSGSTDPMDAAAELCVKTINDYRATLSLPPYERWTDAEACSAEEAQSDSKTMEPHGAFGMCDELAQNECPGWPGPPESMITDCLAQMWAEGPGDFDDGHGHYINMSSTKYTKVACGFFTLPNGDVWAVQNFR